MGLLQAEEMQQKIEKAAIANTGGDEESVQIEEDFKKTSGKNKETKKLAAIKPKAKAALAQTSTKKLVEKDDTPAPDSDTLLTLSTSVAQQASDPEDSQNIQLTEEKPIKLA